MLHLNLAEQEMCCDNLSVSLIFTTSRMISGYWNLTHPALTLSELRCPPHGCTGNMSVVKSGDSGHFLGCFHRFVGV